MKFLTAYRRLLDGEFRYIYRKSWKYKDTIFLLNTLLYWESDRVEYFIREEDAFADDWEGIK